MPTDHDASSNETNVNTETTAQSAQAAQQASTDAEPAPAPEPSPAPGSPAPEPAPEPPAPATEPAPAPAKAARAPKPRKRSARAALDSVDGGAVYPTTASMGSNGHYVQPARGLSLRDHLAISATREDIQAVHYDFYTQHGYPPPVAWCRYEHADRMLEARKVPKSLPAVPVIKTQVQALQEAMSGLGGGIDQLWSGSHAAAKPKDLPQPLTEPELVLQLEAPSNLQPASGAAFVTRMPTLSWNRVPGADRYWVAIGLSEVLLPSKATDLPTARARLVFSAVVAGTFTLAYKLLPNTTYFWNVIPCGFNKGVDGKHAFGPPSATHRFITCGERQAEPKQLEAPVLLLPLSGATDAQLAPLFKWGAVEGADRYQLYVSLQSGILPATNLSCCDTVAATRSSAKPEFKWASKALEPNTTYYWRVHAVDGLGYLGKLSRVFSFTTGAATGDGQ